MIRKRTVPFFVFQTTALVCGLAMVLLPGQGLRAFVESIPLGEKSGLTILVSALLFNLHVYLQHQIEAAFTWRFFRAIPLYGWH